MALNGFILFSKHSYFFGPLSLSWALFLNKMNKQTIAKASTTATFSHTEF